MKVLLSLLAGVGVTATRAAAAEVPTQVPQDFSAPPATNASLVPAEKPVEVASQTWNWHVQNTIIGQGNFGYPAPYDGPQSLNSHGQLKETISLDLMGGVRLWRGAELHADAMMWQGFGLSQTLGVAGFPNGEALRNGDRIPNATFARVFLRQTIGLGGAAEIVADDQLHLAGQRDESRLTFTVGKIATKDIFDGNAYANDPRTQFMNWSLMANGAWDVPADSLGYITGFAAELNLPGWAARYGFFQVPNVANGIALDPHYLEAWSMVAEFEHRHSLAGHPGAIRLLGYLTRARMGDFQLALNSPVRPADITAVEDYRYKFGLGLNLEQEIARNVGLFSRVGWNNGRTEAWCFTDVDVTATLGTSVKGACWGRSDDTFGFAGVLNGLSAVHRDFFQQGGLGILVGDGTLSYGWEQILETYYDVQVWKSVHLTADYQFVANPAYNRERGPVHLLGARMHWEF